MERGSFDTLILERFLEQLLPLYLADCEALNSLVTKTSVYLLVSKTKRGG
jgi:hypothetical protein